MDAEKFWSTTEMNKFLYQQLRTMCEADGFVLSPRKGNFEKSIPLLERAGAGTDGRKRKGNAGGGSV